MFPGRASVSGDSEPTAGTWLVSTNDNRVRSHVGVGTAVGLDLECERVETNSKPCVSGELSAQNGLTIPV